LETQHHSFTINKINKYAKKESYKSTYIKVYDRKNMLILYILA